MIGFGWFFVVNLDLFYRLVNNVFLNEYNFDMLFGGGEKGYIDYFFVK